MTLEVEGSNAVGHRVGVVVGIRSLEDGKEPVQAFEPKSATVWFSELCKTLPWTTDERSNVGSLL